MTDTNAGLNRARDRKAHTLEMEKAAGAIDGSRI
jgi:hypothetical protein